MNMKRFIHTGMLLTLSLALALGLWGVQPAPVARAAGKTLTWQGTSSTAWETASNWYDEGAGATSTTAPNADDIVVIDGSRGATVNPVVTSAGQAAKSLTVGNGFILTISGSSAALVVGDGVAGNNDITIQGGGEIRNLSTANSGNPFSLANSTNDRFRINNGGKYLHNTSRSFNTPFPAVSCDFDVSSTVEFGQNASASIAFSGRTYGNLILSATSAKTYNASGGSPTNIYGTLTLSSSNVTFSPNMSAGQTTRIGNLVVTGGTFSPGSTNAWTLVFTGDITNNGTITLPNSNVTINFDGTSTISGSGAVIFSNGFTVNANTTLAISRNIQVAADKTATINGVFQINDGAWPGNTGTWVYGASSTLVFNNSSGSYGVNNDGYWPSTNGPENVTVQNVGGITMNIARTVNGTFQTSAGVTNAPNLTLNGTVQINTGGWFGSAPIYGANATLVYNPGGSYNISDEWTSGSGSGGGAGAPRNVTIQNNTQVYLPTNAGARAVPGTLTISNGSLTLGNAIGDDLVVGGDWINNGTFNANNRAVIFNGNGVQTIGGSGVTAFGYLIINSGATVVIPATNIPTVANSVTNNGTLKQTLPVNGGPVQFLKLVDSSNNAKYLGVDITSTNDMGNVTVSIRGNQYCTTNTSDPLLKRCFDISPQYTQSANIKFYYTEAERNGQAANALKVWHYNNPPGQWSLSSTSYTHSEGDASCSQAFCWVEAADVSAYSPFTVGSGDAPTAVNLSQIKARPSFGFNVVLVIGILSGGLLLLRRRRA